MGGLAVEGRGLVRWMGAGGGFRRGLVPVVVLKPEVAAIHRGRRRLAL